MFPNFIRLIVGGIILYISIWEFSKVYILNGIFYLLLATLIILTYFKNELLIFALFALRKNKLTRAKKYLSKIKNPKTALITGQQAYFYYLNGLILSQSNLHESEKFLKKALHIGLRGRYDQAMAKLSLAGASIAKRRKREATNLLTEVKKLDNRGLLKEQIQMMKHQMKRI